MDVDAISGRETYVTTSGSILVQKPEFADRDFAPKVGTFRYCGAVPSPRIEAARVRLFHSKKPRGTD